MRPWGVFALLAVSLAVLPTGAQSDLFSYLAKADEAFRWELRGVTEKPTGKVYDLHLVSQVWQGITWEHQLQVYEPKEVAFGDLMPLLITGGSADDEAQGLGLTVAGLVGARVAVLYHIPNQPLFDDLREDGLISYTWMKYMETGDEDWILLFPMAKAAVRAMDCLEQLAQQQWTTKLRGFVPLGASKRGWTTYLTAIAAPERCLAMVPMVFDILNMPVQLQHQYDFWGHYSPQISEYTDKGVQHLMDSERGFRLSWINDPYSYRDRMLMPKLIVLGSNDPYWPTDAVNYYYPGLPAPKLLLITPNSGHGLNDLPRVVGSVGAFFRLVARGEPLPKLSCQFDESAEGLKLSVSADPKPAEARIWVAHAAQRDFGKAQWTEAPLTDAGDTLTATIARVEGQDTAAYGELVFPVDNLRLTVSTQPRVMGPTPK
jgi:PhoPQ-activated pathogenicity-related protein